MLPTYDLVKLKALLKDFYHLTHIRITIFNTQFDELVSYPEARAPFCQLIRQDATARLACRHCDEQACQIALKKRGTHSYRCHAGLTEAIAPLYLNDLLIGYLFFGHIFSYPSYEIGWAAIEPLCTAYQVDLAALKKACTAQPLIAKDYIVSASHIVKAIASYVCLERMVMLKPEDLPLQINTYIETHLTEPITAKTLCEHFQLGKTSLYQLAHQAYGMGIAEHIRTLRIKKAQVLLMDAPDLPISEIAYACGFNDYNYFITVFKRLTGYTPKQFRLQAVSYSRLDHCKLFSFF